MLITDHNVRETLGICDRATIINDGEVLAAGQPDEIVDNESVRKIYLGEHFKNVGIMRQDLQSQAQTLPASCADTAVAAVDPPAAVVRRWSSTPKSTSSCGTIRSSSATRSEEATRWPHAAGSAPTDAMASRDSAAPPEADEATGPGSDEAGWGSDRAGNAARHPMATTATTPTSRAVHFPARAPRRAAGMMPLCPIMTATWSAFSVEALDDDGYLEQDLEERWTCCSKAWR